MMKYMIHLADIIMIKLESNIQLPTFITDLSLYLLELLPHAMSMYTYEKKDKKHYHIIDTFLHELFCE